MEHLESLVFTTIGAVDAIRVIGVAIRIIKLVLVYIVEVCILVHFELVQLHQVLRVQLSNAQFEEGVFVVDRLKGRLWFEKLLQLRQACLRVLLMRLRLALNLGVGKCLQERIFVHKLREVG